MGQRSCDTQAVSPVVKFISIGLFAVLLIDRTTAFGATTPMAFAEKV